MSALVDGAIEAAGLSGIVGRRRAGAGGAPSADDIARLRGVDLLALGALADRVRREEVGDEVRIFAPPPPAEEAAASGAVVLPPEDAELTGLELLREVAVARVAGTRGRRVRVDWSRCGLEIAQIALGFGANEMSGHVVRKDGQPIAPGELLGVGKKSRQRAAAAVKRSELAGFVRRAGRVAVFVGGEEGEEEEGAGAGADARADAGASADARRDPALEAE